MRASTHSILVLLLLYISFVACEETVVDLYADEKLSLQTIFPGDENANIYNLHNLAPNSRYEVRISYPSYTPADFKLEIMEPIDNHNSRELLNIEKEMFTTDENGYITNRAPPEHGFYRMKVTVNATGVLPDNSAPKEPFQFNIVLETLFFGAPYGVLKIGIFVAIMCVMMATILVPQLFPHMPGFKKLVD